jgi:hypothetical protein
VISINGLHAFVNRLSHADIERTEADALEQAAHNLEESVKAGVSSLPDNYGTNPHGREAAMSASISRRTDVHSAVIGAVGSAAVTRELGSATQPPDHVLGAATRQSGSAIAERIGQVFAQLLTEMLND